MNDLHERLRKAVSSSYRALRPYREAVVKLNKEYAGPMYGLGDETGRREKPLNMLKQACSAYMMLLASNRPQVLLTTAKMELKPFADHFQVGLNKLLETIEIETTLSQWVRDAFFWIGIVKVHMADTGQLIDEGDLTMDPGRPFASNIALDDCFWDVNAKKWSECKFIGDCYRLPLETLKESDLYEGEALEDLQATSKYNAGDEKLRDISMGNEVDDDELEPMCDVCDIWVPREGKIFTYIVTSRQEMTIDPRPIAEMEWRGRELGPYKVLHFDEVSENIMPCSTAADLYPLHRQVNNLFRKNSAKAHRQKSITAFSPAGTEGADKVRRASDGDMVPINDPKELNVINQGGIDAGLHGFMLNSMELFDRMAGNLQAMMGLGPSSETVGQDKLIHASASKREDQLQLSVVRSTAKLITDIAYLLWEDEYTELPVRVNVSGLSDVSYDATWRPKDRMGSFDDYDFQVDVYSMQYQGPGARVTAINRLLGEVYIPLLPMIQQQGGSIDFAKLAQLHSEMMNLPRLNEIVVFNSPPQEAPTPQQDGARKPPTSNRTYTRRNVSGGQSANPSADEWMKQTQTA